MVLLARAAVQRSHLPQWGGGGGAGPGLGAAPAPPPHALSRLCAGASAGMEDAADSLSFVSLNSFVMDD